MYDSTPMITIARTWPRIQLSRVEPISLKVSRTALRRSGANRRTMPSR